MPTCWIQLSVEGSSMNCYVGTTDQNNAPGIVVCMHAPGVDEFIQDIVDRLVASGYCAIAADLHHRDPNVDDEPQQRLGRLRDNHILADLETATAYLRGLPQVDQQRIGTIGFCMGGRVAFLHAANDHDLRACVVFYGGNIMKAWGDGAPPISYAPNINCPVLGLFGKEDTNPSPADVNTIAAELERDGKTYDFHRYDGCGHAFLNFTRPSYRADAAQDAWNKCVAWLDRHVKPA